MELIILLIILCVIVLGVVISLSLIVYNQLLMTNEINKRLLLLTSESMERERISADALRDQLDRVQPTEAGAYKVRTDIFEEEDSKGFDPHLYDSDTL